MRKESDKEVNLPKSLKITTEKKITLDYNLNTEKLLKDNKIEFEIISCTSFREED